MDILPVIITGALAFAGSAGLWTYADHRKQYKEAKDDRQDEILIEMKSIHSDIDGLREEMRENDAKINKRLDWDKADAARNRILRFDDELRRGEPHSLEFFNQIIDDVDWYREFCANNKGKYENSKAEDAMVNIMEHYHEAKIANQFI